MLKHNKWALTDEEEGKTTSEQTSKYGLDKYPKEKLEEKIFKKKLEGRKKHIYS